MLTVAFYHESLGWCLAEKGHEDEADPFCSYMTWEAPDDVVLREAKECFELEPDDVIEVRR